MSEEELEKPRKKRKTTPQKKSAKEIADEVTTLAKFRALEKKLESADQKRQEFQAYDSRSLKREESLDKRYDILQEAYDIASEKFLRWQFLPHGDIDTPLSILERAYKVISFEEFDEKYRNTGNTEDWCELRGDEEAD